MLKVIQMLLLKFVVELSAAPRRAVWGLHPIFGPQTSTTTGRTIGRRFRRL